ncbi:DUF2125 domain-containing protein [Yoonia sp. 208BN28-4]|uniref:DUF2125 domain-containing protein n=1 Tax=Yoonia sp. 208BN28-4 TaxID=3126505 RepID=UPI0030AE9566
MRRLTIVVIVLALLYSGYWMIGAMAMERGVRQAFDDLRADGWQVTYDDLGTRGFPSRFDTTVDALDMTAPDDSLQYQAPFLQALALSYQPNKLIVVFPESQTLRLGADLLALDADALRASAAVNLNADLSLDAITFEGDSAALALGPDITLATNRVIAALREAGPVVNRYDVYTNLDTITLPDAMRAALDPNGQHPDSIADLTLNSTVTLDRPLDRHSIAQFETDPALITAVTVKEAQLQWGTMAVSANGDLTVDQSGVPTGEIDISVQDWRAMIAAASNAGLIEPGFDTTFENLAAALSEGRDTLELTLSFSDGRMSIGPFPLGPAPRLHP